MLARIFNRLLDDSFEPEIRHNISIVTLGRLVANACYRFAPPFLAIIAKDFNVSLSDIGVAVFVSELSGFGSPLAGRIVDRLTHRNAMVIGLVGTILGCLFNFSSWFCFFRPLCPFLHRRFWLIRIGS